MRGHVGLAMLVCGLACTLMAREGQTQAAGRQFESYRADWISESNERSGTVVSGSMISWDRRDYRWEGLIAGAVIIGTVGAIGFNNLCHSDDTGDGNCVAGTVAGGVLGALVGGVVGGLIGAQIPKHQPDSS